MDFAEFLRGGYEYARRCLEDEGEFPPFAMLRGAAASKTLLPEDGVLETLNEVVASAVATDTFTIVALFAMADVETDQGTQRCISAHIETVDGLSKLVLTPYLVSKGQVAFGTPTTLDAPPHVFAKPSARA